ARWGDYRLDTKTDGAKSREPQHEPQTEGGGERSWRWQRTPREAELTLDVPATTTKPVEHELPDSGGLALVLTGRSGQITPATKDLIPKGTRSVSVFLVNRRSPQEEEQRSDESSIFQAELEVRSEQPLVPRPNLGGVETDDWDEKVADLQYRDAYEYAVGHGVATRAVIEGDGVCRSVCTCWIPTAEVELVAPAPIPDVERRMETLAGLPDGTAAKKSLQGIVDNYRSWIEAQKPHVPKSPTQRKDAATELLSRARHAADRIEAGVRALADPQVLEAFRL